MTQDLEYTCEALPQSLLHPPRGRYGVPKRPEPEANYTDAKHLFLIAHINEESQIPVIMMIEVDRSTLKT